MNNKRKIFIGIIIAIVFLLAVFSAIIMIRKKANYEYKIEEITEGEYQYFLVNSDNKYGVLDTKGNIVIDIKYDEIVIPNPKKAVFICSYNNENSNEVLDENGETLFGIYDNVEAIKLDGLITPIPYEKQVLKFSVNGQYGLIDLDGNRITKAIYEDIKGLKYKEGELTAKKDGKYGVIALNGSKIINFEYDNIQADKYFVEGQGYTNSGYIVSNTTDEGYRYGYISQKGSKILNVEYNEIKRISDIEGDDIYLIASQNGQYGLLKNKEVLVDFKYQGIEYNSLNNLIILNRGTKYGVYTLEGREIVPIDYKTLQFNGTIIYAKTGSDVNYFTNDGKAITNGLTSKVPVNNKKYYITIDKNGLYGVLDSNENVVIENKYVYMEYLYDNYFSAYKNGSGLGIVSATGNTILDFEYTAVNKISNANLLKVTNMNTSLIKIYSFDMKEIVALESAELSVKEKYLKLSNDEKTVYLDLNGNIISETKAKELSVDAPDFIGKYGKTYYGFSQIVYTDKE